MDQRLLHKSIASLPVFDVVIVGAGLAGLRVAAGCEERGVSYVLLEASSTVGGRVRRAPDWFLPGIGLDLGGEAIHGSTTPLNRLAQLANVETQEFFVVSQGDGGPDEAPVNGKIGYYYYQPAGSSRKEIRRYDELDENAQRAHSMLAELAEVASLDQLDVPDAGNSLGSLMDAIGISQGVRALLDAGYANTDSANSIDELSLSRVVDFENDWAEHDGCAEASDFAIVNDDECLADLAGELLKRIDTTRLRVNAVVERVDTLSESGVVAVSCRDPRNARGMRVVARAAVVCVPLAQLKRGAIVFTPPLERVKRSAIDALRVHSGCKVTLKYLARPAPNASPSTTTTTTTSSSSSSSSSFDQSNFFQFPNINFNLIFQSKKRNNNIVEKNENFEPILNFGNTTTSTTDTTTSDSSSSTSTPTTTTTTTNTKTYNSKSVPSSSKSWLMPDVKIQVKVCRRVSHPLELVVDYMTNCNAYDQWWPETYDFKVMKCNVGKTGTKVHFNSNGGEYDTVVTHLDKHNLTLTYSGILEGTQDWTVKEIPDGCELCYETNLKPMTYSGRLAASVSSNDYLASYFEPLANALEKELNAKFDHGKRKN